MGTLLAIDTAAPRLQLALLSDGDRVMTLVEDMATGQAERLFPALDELLAEAGIAYADLTRIAVTTGPGSFTGLRIGLSAWQAPRALRSSLPGWRLPHPASRPALP